MARATQKRGTVKREVDLDTIKAGLQDALEKKRNEEGKVANAKAKYLRRWRNRRKSLDFSFSIAEDEEEDDEELLEYFMLGLNPLMEEVEGLNPKDRAAYLGFRSSLEDFAVDEEVVPERPSWLSFFR